MASGVTRSPARLCSKQRRDATRIIFSQAPEHRRKLDTERLRRFAPNSAFCTGDPLVLLHTLYSRTYIVRATTWAGTSVKFQFRLELPPCNESTYHHEAPRSQTGFWTRAEVDGGHNKGPPQTSYGAKSVPRWCEGQTSMHSHQYTYTQGRKNN